MKVTEEQKQLLADAISTYDEVCWWKYSPEELRKEAFNSGEKPPTKEMVSEEMIVNLIIRIVEGEK